MEHSNGNKPRSLRCTIIGAGVSGLLMAYKLRKHLDGYVDFQIYEKNPELGGTWYENKYPGCACDVPSHCYQYSFAPNPAWSKFYASSQEIQAYLKGVAKHFNLEKYIHFNTQVIAAKWDEQTATWNVNLQGGQTVTSEILINAGGILNHPQLPSIEGLSDFSGPMLHTATWDSSVDLRGKSVGIIGSGASAVQVLPQIQPLCSQIQIYIRTPSWISRPVALPADMTLNYTYRADEKDEFKKNAESYLRVRKDFEYQFNSMFRAFTKTSPEQESIRSTFEARMKALIPDEALQKRLIPSFEVGCRRINPGEQYLIALQQPNVEPVFDAIERITSTGVVAGNREFPADILIAATGFNTSFTPRFPIIGRGNVNLQDLWMQDPVSYLGTGVSGFPNYFVFLGPNTPIGNGSVMGSVEATGDYFVRILRKMVRQRVKSFDVRPEAQRDFDQHTQAFMQNMVWTGSCRSWYKKGQNGKITALWPGSSLHYIQVLAENRWEDYEWNYDGERYAYWKKGISWIEDVGGDPLGLAEQESMRTMTTIPGKDSDLSFYLWNCPPLPKDCIPCFQDVETVDLADGDVAFKVASYKREEKNSMAEHEDFRGVIAKEFVRPEKEPLTVAVPV